MRAARTPRWLSRLLLLVALPSWLALPGQAQDLPVRAGPIPDSLVQRLAAVPAELHLAGGRLRIVNLHAVEAATLSEFAGADSAVVVEALTRRVFRPHAAFWEAYLGDEARFRAWAAGALLAPDHPIHTRLAGVLGLHLDSLFTASATWLVRVTGHQPAGTWYLVFGPGWTDMGGLGDGTMVADFTRLVPDPGSLQYTLPHELTHMVHGASDAMHTDPDRGTVLARIISEGLASYATQVYAAGRLTPAESVGYTESEWQWALAHEPALVAASRPHLRSSSRADLDRFSSRGQQLLDPGPTAVAYFLGYRIIEAYVARHGAASWADAIDLPVREVLARSGHPL